MKLAWLFPWIAYTAMMCGSAGCYSPGRGLQTPFAVLENSLVFAPVRYPEGNWELPNFEYEDVTFESTDGTKLHAWYLPHPRPRAFVLYAHGNAGNLTHRARAMQQLRDQHDLSIMIFDYRGYGRSEGVPDEEGILQDARAARNWLSQREGISESQIVLFGRSLGGGVAVDLAADQPPRGLVLISTFSSLPDVGGHAISWLPVRTLMRYQLNSQEKIENYRGPLLQCHGDADRVIPIEIGRKLFDAANEPKQFIQVNDGRHNDPLTEEFHTGLDRFIGSLP